MKGDLQGRDESSHGNVHCVIIGVKKIFHAAVPIGSSCEKAKNHLLTVRCDILRKKRIKINRNI